MKPRYTNKDGTFNSKEDNNFYLGIALIIILLAGLTATLIYLDKRVELAKKEGMQQAERNCLEFLCSKQPNGCTLDTSVQIDKYCKSLIYKTDLYMRLK